MTLRLILLSLATLFGLGTAASAQEGLKLYVFTSGSLGGFPKAGDVLAVGAFELRVEAMDGMRVARLKLNKRAEA